MPYFKNEGFDLHYELHPGLAPADVLFIHGNLASNVWWEPVVEIWRRQHGEKGHPGSLILAEWRGCGKSQGPRTEADLDMESLARDCVGLLRHLGTRSAATVGHSTGGLIALLALMQAPEIFTRSVLLDPVSPAGVRLDPAILDAMKRMSQDRELCAAVMGGTIRDNDASSPRFQRIVDAAFGVHPLLWAGVPRILGGIDYRPKLSAVRQPVLVLHGEHDPVLPLRASREFAAQLPHGRFEALEGRGHSCNVEDPARFVERAYRFLFASE